MHHPFPNPVKLPDDLVIDFPRLQIALGQPSRALLYSWRKRKGFPVFHRSSNSTFYMTGDVETWLHHHGIMTKRV